MSPIKKALFLSVLVSSLFAACKKDSNSNSSEQGSVVFKGKTMGTTYTIRQGGPSFIKQEKIDSTLRAIDTALSTYNKFSYITAFNLNEDLSQFDSCYKIHFEYVARLAFRIHSLSYGSFDPSASRLFNYWGFGENGPNAKKSSTEFQMALAEKGMHKLYIYNEPIGKTDSSLKLNFNAIAKGYGVDVIAALLRDNNCKNFMIEIGGEVYCGGLNAEGKPWSIGINNPIEGSSKTDFNQVVRLNNQAVATSGNYRNFYEKDGEKYGHSIDPRTGYPAKNKVLSVSIIASSCAEADAWATASMVWGLDSTLAYLQDSSLTNVDSAYLIYEQNGSMKDTILRVSKNFPFGRKWPGKNAIE
jgi:FAD:protein FMN transferase